MELLNNRYELIEILSDKGDLITCKGRDTREDCDVILKYIDLKTLSDWKLWDLFEREIEIISKLQHPGLPAYIDHFQVESGENAGYYLVNSYIPGHSLEEMLASGYRFTADELTEITLAILDTLEYLHQNKPSVIHRDINPKNIIRTEDGRYCLIDFGASKRIFEEKATGTTAVMGTYGYIPMEQMIGEALPQSDIYALGMTIIHLKTGIHPGKFEMNEMRPDYLKGARPEFIDELVARMIEPDANKRSRSARKLADALRRHSVSDLGEAGTDGSSPKNRMPINVSSNIEIERHNDTRILSFYNEKSQKKESAPLRVILDLWLNKPWLCIIGISIVSSGSLFLPLLILHMSGIGRKWLRRTKSQYAVVEIHKSRDDIRIPNQIPRVPRKAIKLVEHYARRAPRGYQTEFVLKLHNGEKKSFYMSDMSRDDIEAVNDFLETD